MKFLIALPFLFALTIAPGLDRRLAKWKPVRMPCDSSGLDARQKQVVEKLVEASRFLESIYWQQSDPEVQELYKTTKNPGAQDGSELLRTRSIELSAKPRRATIYDHGCHSSEAAPAITRNGHSKASDENRFQNQGLGQAEGPSRPDLLDPESP